MDKLSVSLLIKPSINESMWGQHINLCAPCPGTRAWIRPQAPAGAFQAL